VDGWEVADLDGNDRPDLVAAGGGGVWVRLNTPGLCNVQFVRNLTLSAAKNKLALVNCRVGRVRHASSRRIKKGRVISQKPKFGTVLRGGARVSLVVSRGPRR
jgi:beta-lactam-binding protein with PASTA domain